MTRKRKQATCFFLHYLSFCFILYCFAAIDKKLHRNVIYNVDVLKLSINFTLSLLLVHIYSISYSNCNTKMNQFTHFILELSLYVHY